MDDPGDHEAEVQSALAAADAYMDAFNARDQEGMAAACHYPHVRLASGTVRVWDTPQDSMVPGLFELLEAREGWHHSRWNHRRVIHAGATKVHLDVSFTRYNAEDQPLGEYPSIWVITRDQNDHWGIQARSSYAA